MKLNELEIKSHKSSRRLGRGIGSGRGKTAGRGTKGQNARTGGGVRLGFEGGQNPLAKRLPKKRGFTPFATVRYQVVNLTQLEKAFKAGQMVDLASLQKTGLIKSIKKPAKLLGQGELTYKLTVKVQAISKTARTAVEKAGGKVELAPLERTKVKDKTNPKA